MRAADIGKDTCSVARTVSVVGDPWTLLLLRELFLGTRRFEAFQALTGMSTALLSARLARLVEEGIVRKVPYQRRPVRHEYRLTEKGIDLYPVVVSLMQWGDRWGGAKVAEPPVRLVHKTCGTPCEPRLVCPACGEGIDPHTMRADLSPALKKKRHALLGEETPETAADAS